MGTKFDDQLATVVKPLVEEGESLHGMCAGSWQKSMFSQSMVAFAVTDKRLIVQSANRKWEPDGEPLSLTRDQIASSKVRGAGDAGDISGAIMSKSAVKVQIKTVEGEKLKFMLMRGTGPLGGFGGGETQRQGVEALASFLT
ncbi:MAG TPA: hypothetical protein VD766_11545 [Solirubrobacterales bacterium]|nr:hypothetical protein [Solirubrobacterales bacterium]